MTPLHYDNNENLVQMVSGAKTFSLFAPAQRGFLYPASNGQFAVGSRIPGGIEK